ncbi:hypothetical protein PO909_022970 [Leuciscus waleckii]
MACKEHPCFITHLRAVCLCLTLEQRQGARRERRSPPQNIFLSMAPKLVGDARRREAYLITIKLSHTHTHTSASRLPSACEGGSVPGFSSANHNSCEDILGGKNCSSTSQQDIPRGQRLGKTIEHINKVLRTCTTLVSL